MQTFKTSKAKEKILSKIRSGLNGYKLPMPFPEAEAESVNSVFKKQELSAEETFAEEFTKLGGKFVYCDNEQEFLENLHSLYDSRGWKDLLCTEADLLEKFHNNRLEFIHPASPDNESADACITYCEALVARTGSAIISSKQNLGRVAPVYYPVHIMVAYPSQIVRDIDEGLSMMQKKYGNDLPSMINLNTGPSRTADIEKTLVVGVHGPGEVFCFLLNV
jgi:L-lactate dehydrogenase complex protein LldG